MEEIILKFKYEEADITSAIREHYNTSHIRLYMFFTFAFSMLGIAVAFLPEMFFLGYTLALVMGMCSLYYYSVYYNVPQKMFERNPDFYGKPVTFRFSETEIFYFNEHCQSQIEWANYKQVKETRDSYILFQDTDFLTVIPKRVFSNQRELLDFKDLLKRKIKTYSTDQGLFANNNETKKEPEKYLPPETPPDWR
jgi:hypothetical protein